MSDKTPWTQGPWKYSTNVGPTRALIVEQDGSTVVEMMNRTHDSRFAHNARLIAAAPEMAELLSKISDAYEPVDYVPAVRDLLKRIGAP